MSKFYNSVGFADFRVISVTADLLPTKEGFAITYSIDEGEKYKFGKITLKNKCVLFYVLLMNSEYIFLKCSTNWTLI